VKFATGPFTYDPPLAGEATFLGDIGSSSFGEFTIYAPSGGTSFPSGATATATIKVFGVEKVADADGIPLDTPLDIPLDSELGSRIAAAFTLTPDSNTFSPGGYVAVAVSVANPMVAEADYGQYVVTMKAQSPGSGVGVGSGSRFRLTLKAAESTDTTPPNVVINNPADASSHILGPIAVNITANDPSPGTGVASISAKVSSLGGAVTDKDIPLTIAPPPIVPAGTDAVGTGTFNPVNPSGGSKDGTTLASAFDSANPSGIGTYRLTAMAKDAAIPANVRTATSTFGVKYDVQFLIKEGNENKGKPDNSHGHFQFTVKRSSPADFIYDKTVKVELIQVSNGKVVATHVYTGGGGGVFENVVFSDTPLAYETKFRRSDIGASGSGTYQAKIYFMDVDGNFTEQAVSDNVTF
jgi:hypothetical protein